MPGRLTPIVSPAGQLQVLRSMSLDLIYKRKLSGFAPTALPPRQPRSPPAPHLVRNFIVPVTTPTTTDTSGRDSVQYKLSRCITNPSQTRMKIMTNPVSQSPHQCHVRQHPGSLRQSPLIPLHSRQLPRLQIHGLSRIHLSQYELESRPLPPV